MTAPIVLDLDAIEAAAKAATPQDFDSAELKVENGHVECPQCGGQGEVELLAEYTNFDGVAIGVQFFGIGHEFGAAEAFYRAANPAVVLELARRLRTAEAAVSARLSHSTELAGITAIHMDVSEHDVEQLRQLFANSKADDHQLMVMPLESRLEHLDEEQMRQAGWVRAQKWQPMDTVPTNNEPILVLLEEGGSRRDSAQRVQHAQFCIGGSGHTVATIGDHFAFDKPKPIGWMFPPEPTA